MLQSQHYNVCIRQNEGKTFCNCDEIVIQDLYLCSHLTIHLTVKIKMVQLSNTVPNATQKMVTG